MDLNQIGSPSTIYVVTTGALLAFSYVLIAASTFLAVRKLKLNHPRMKEITIINPVGKKERLIIPPGNDFAAMEKLVNNYTRFEQEVEGAILNLRSTGFVSSFERGRSFPDFTVETDNGKIGIEVISSLSANTLERNIEKYSKVDLLILQEETIAHATSVNEPANRQEKRVRLATVVRGVEPLTEQLRLLLSERSNSDNQTS